MTWKEIIDYSIEKAAVSGIALTLSINVQAGSSEVAVAGVPVNQPRPKRRSKSGVPTLSGPGYVALAAIANQSIDAYGKSLNWLAATLSLSRNALYRDTVFRKIFEEYNRTGRMPRSGVWNSQTGTFDGASYDKDIDED